ncbi:MAG: Uma2 family endonuclease, partial [Chloracidobacterium sp.]
MPILSELALPTMDDLPSEFEGEEALPDEFHAFLAYLLIETFRPPKFLPDRYFSALDMYLYYQAQPTLHGLRPDWFGVVDVPLLRDGRQRTSFVVWEEKATPLIIVEALSP